MGHRLRREKRTRFPQVEQLETRELLSIGTFLDGTWLIDANNNDVWDGTTAGDVRVQYGSTGDIPVTGDWSGRGHDQIGVYRAGRWLLDTNDNWRWDGADGGDTIRTFVDGIPVVGDWDGNGVDQIGSYNKGVWSLDWNGNGRWDGVSGGDKRFLFGNSNDFPIAGDWNGRGKDQIGVYRDGQWTLDLNGNGSWNGTSGGDGQYYFAFRQGYPLAADFNGDQVDDFLQFKRRTDTWRVDVNGNRTFDSTDGGDASFDFGQAGSLPVYISLGSTAPLSANAGDDRVADEGSTVEFAGSASGTQPLSYLWDFGDGTGTSGTLTPRHTYDDNGSFAVTLTVSDANGETARGSLSVSVRNVAPSVDPGGPYMGTLAVLIAFAGTASDTSHADTTAGFTYRWDFGDGATANGGNASHAYASAGTYAVRLTATDKDGGSTTAQTSATVQNPSTTTSSPFCMLEDFGSLRRNGDGTDLWGPYLGEDPGQTGRLENGTYRVDVPSGNGVYFQFFPRSGGYPFPNGFMQHYIESGTWDPNTNRLSFWVKSSKTITRNPDGSSLIELGTYVKDHANPDNAWQGDHYYHIMDPNVYAGQWMLVVINRTPQHKVGEDPNINWGDNPSAPKVNYMDGLTRFYLDSQGTQFQNSTWWFDDFSVATVASEPDDLIASLTATYTGTRYEVTWDGPKNIAQDYEVRYSTQSMKANGFASGTAAGTVHNPGSAYTGTIWQSSAMVQAPVLYVAVRPAGQTAFTEVKMPMR